MPEIPIKSSWPGNAIYDVMDVAYSAPSLVWKDAD